MHLNSFLEKQPRRLFAFVCSLPEEVQYQLVARGPLPPDSGLNLGDCERDHVLRREILPPTYDYSSAPESAAVHAVKAIRARLAELPEGLADAYWKPETLSGWQVWAMP